MSIPADSNVFSSMSKQRKSASNKEGASLYVFLIYNAVCKLQIPIEKSLSVNVGVLCLEKTSYSKFACLFRISSADIRHFSINSRTIRSHTNWDVCSNKLPIGCME